jgi:hypothetical protein
MRQLQAVRTLPDRTLQALRSYVYRLTQLNFLLRRIPQDSLLDDLHRSLVDGRCRNVSEIYDLYRSGFDLDLLLWLWGVQNAHAARADRDALIWHVRNGE